MVRGSNPVGPWLARAVSVTALAMALAQGSAAMAQDAGASEGEEVIIVTAQRREQTLFEVPQSVSVLGERELERQNATSLADYAKLVPGLNVQAQDPGLTRIVLRGTNTGSVGTTVASYIDDMPFGSSGSLMNAGILSGDFDPFDIARIEVLRGPQGTLYGSNSLGGVLKYITNLPSTAMFEVRGLAGVETVAHGGTGYNANAMVNVPLGDTLAFRASGFYRKRAGFIDALGFNQKDVNASESYGGRAALLFKPTENFSIRLQTMLQNIDGDQPSAFNVEPASLAPIDVDAGGGLGGERTRFQLYPDSFKMRYRLYAGTLEWDFGPASLSSITSYSHQKYFAVTDASTNALRGLVNLLYAPTQPNSVGFIFTNDQQVKKFTQEVRLSSADSDTFEWTVGGYYTNEKTALFQRYAPFRIADRVLLPRELTLAPGVTVPEFVVAFIDAKYREIAGFGSATWHVSDRFDITAGGRYSHNKQSSDQSVIQLGQGGVVSGGSSEGVFTWSVSPRLELSDRASVYARVAKGYRPGGPNFIPPNASPDFPATFDADTLVSYEIGLRAETADRSFSFSGSAFYLDWKDILILTTADSPAGPVGINGNGRRARSQGFEFTATARPIEGMNVTLSGAYTDAKLRDDTVPASGGLNLVGGRAGDPLPFVPKYTATLSADYEWALSGGAKAFIGGNVRLVSDQTGTYSADYVATYGRQVELDGYGTVDLRAGVDFEKFTITVFAQNLTDTYGLTSVTPTFITAGPEIGGSGVPYIGASSIRPRTIGATLGFKL